MSNQITLENIDNVLKFITLFSSQHCHLYDIQTEPLTLEPYSYSQEFDRFVAALYAENFVIPFDWINWQQEATRFVIDPVLINLADILTIQKLFTSHVRQERFCSGHLAQLIDNGYFLTILQRLQTIRKNLILENNVMQQIEIIQGDITQLQVDAIVNAANSSLLGGGGVDGAIHRAAGRELLVECRQLGGCETGEAKITKGYNLPAKWVIHTVGPVWEGGNQNEDVLLANCYVNSLAFAAQYQIKTIAFPAISTGVYAFPMERACKIAITTVTKFLQNPNSLEQVIFVCFGQTAYNSYTQVMREVAET
ncbi:Appr-1-p processing domain protein [Nostoc sp. NIES-3756]|uniref:O-acetyl-ADP-ribose deacetylase n=1 Tax=Nostoc sp. NIES-3756 TaxID=1751286 RepID=UPI0007228455|nr:O-acetyl-ADP-ribose deacetylase [Nostoc sp. NIES-3756]BAT55743.1 Appr-1-p processing domain protein [Nostoc sp. NIES-3756]